jgi:hypothetical protein
MKNGKGHKWLIAGTVLSAAGIAAGLAIMKHSNVSMRTIRNKAACVTSKAGHDAGDFISSVGDSLANRIR